MAIRTVVRSCLNWTRTLIQFKIIHRYVRYGRNVHVQWSTTVWSPHRHIVIGNNVGIGHYCVLGADIDIGNNVLIGSGTGLVGSDDHLHSIIGTTMWDSPRGDTKKIVIEDDVWIGYGCIILAGSRVGRGSVVAAGTIVVRDVDPYSVVAGVPARKVKMRFSETEIREHEALLSNPTKV